jgi:hypothetical protein
MNKQLGNISSLLFSQDPPKATLQIITTHPQFQGKIHRLMNEHHNKKSYEKASSYHTDN